MLTEQNSSGSAETVSLTLGTVPVGFIISDDGHSLLAVIGKPNDFIFVIIFLNNKNI